MTSIIHAMHTTETLMHILHQFLKIQYVLPDMQKYLYSPVTGSDCVTAGFGTGGSEGWTGAPGIGMPAGGHTGFGIIPTHR